MKAEIFWAFNPVSYLEDSMDKIEQLVDEKN